MNTYLDKIAIVTGGASGIGKSISAYLAGMGARVIIADIDYVLARETSMMINSTHNNTKAEFLDVSNKKDFSALIHKTYKEYQRIDFLFNNAGYSMNGEFQDINMDQWERIFNVNFWSVVNGCHYVYPLMIKQGFGQIINTASLAGLIPGGLMTSYTATKHAILGLSLSLRAEAKQYGIKINTLCPGYIRTNAQKSNLVVTDYLRNEKNRNMEENMKFPTPDECVRQMMKSIEKNKAIILTPSKHKIYWWMNRISPEIIPNMFNRIIKKMKNNAVEV